MIETTKPYVCNSIRLPALALILVAKSVNCSREELTIICDGFIVYKFTHASDFSTVVAEATKVRQELASALAQELEGEACDRYTLAKHAVHFLRADVEYILSRRAWPDENVEDGFMMPHGELLQESDAVVKLASEDNQDLKLEKELSTNKMDKSKCNVQYFCEICRKELSFPSVIEILRHKKSH